jgi:hypothetical protein
MSRIHLFDDVCTATKHNYIRLDLLERAVEYISANPFPGSRKATRRGTFLGDYRHAKGAPTFDIEGWEGQRVASLATLREPTLRSATGDWKDTPERARLVPPVWWNEDDTPTALHLQYMTWASTPTPRKTFHWLLSLPESDAASSSKKGRKETLAAVAAEVERRSESGARVFEAFVAKNEGVSVAEMVEAEAERARDDDGHFVADDPDTWETNEAWEGGEAPAKPEFSSSMKKKELLSIALDHGLELSSTNTKGQILAALMALE